MAAPRPPAMIASPLSPRRILMNRADWSSARNNAQHKIPLHVVVQGDLCFLLVGHLLGFQA